MNSEYPIHFSQKGAGYFFQKKEDCFLGKKGAGYFFGKKKTVSTIGQFIQKK